MKDYRKVSSLDSEYRVDKYIKDFAIESFYEELNLSNKELNDKLLNSYSSGHSPSVLIISMPRTGSTLLTQLLASKLDIGYTSNLMAAFYETPMVGGALQKNLMSNEMQLLQSFNSEHGKTKNIFEPHEFGYFWARHLGFGKDIHQPESRSDINQIDFQSLEKELNGVSSLFNKTMVYKCSIGAFLLDQILDNTSCFVIHLSRDKKETVSSVLKVREERLGSQKIWWSIRPKGYDEMAEKPPVQQVEWQYDKVENAINEKSKGYTDRILKVNYFDVKNHPEKVIEQFTQKYFEYTNVEITKK